MCIYCIFRITCCITPCASGRRRHCNSVYSCLLCYWCHIFYLYLNYICHKYFYCCFKPSVVHERNFRKKNIRSSLIFSHVFTISKTPCSFLRSWISICCYFPTTEVASCSASCWQPILPAFLYPEMSLFHLHFKGFFWWIQNLCRQQFSFLPL